jgi:hypothetical protein
MYEFYTSPFISVLFDRRKKRAEYVTSEYPLQHNLEVRSQLHRRPGRRHHLIFSVRALTKQTEGGK